MPIDPLWFRFSLEVNNVTILLKITLMLTNYEGIEEKTLLFYAFVIGVWVPKLAKKKKKGKSRLKI